jgi:hypothetical protein
MYYIAGPKPEIKDNGNFIFNSFILIFSNF